MRHRIPAGTKVSEGHVCPRCAEDDAFITCVALGDYVEFVQSRCPSCGSTLSVAEAEAIKTKALEGAAELAIGELEDR